MMSVKVLLLFFSGTGNTKIVSNLIKDEFKSNNLYCELSSIEDIETLPEGYDTIGIGYPVYGFICPHFVLDQIKRLKIRDKDIFFYKTCGNDHTLNSTSSYKLNRLLRKENRIVKEYTLPMASNWLYYSSESTIKNNLNLTKTRVQDIVTDIKESKIGELKISPVKAFFLNGIGFLEEFVGASHWGKGLHMKSNCTRCGLCEKKCPTGNIKNLKFGWKCIWCMRCIYICPEAAIKARFFNSAILKNGYNSKWLFK